MSGTNSSYSRNIGNSDLSVSDGTTRILELGTDTNLQIRDANGRILISAVDGNGITQQFFLSAYIDEGDGNSSEISGDATASQTVVTLSSDFNDGVNQARIQFIANAIGSYLNHSATHNNFELVNYADNAAALVGGLEVGDLYHTAGVVKIVI